MAVSEPFLLAEFCTLYRLKTGKLCVGKSHSSTSGVATMWKSRRMLRILENGCGVTLRDPPVDKELAKYPSEMKLANSGGTARGCRFQTVQRGAISPILAWGGLGGFAHTRTQA